VDIVTRESDIEIPEFMEWTGDWSIEAKRAGEEFVAGKSYLEMAMARIYLIWYTGIWRAVPYQEVDLDTGELTADTGMTFEYFEDVVNWFEERWGLGRSTVFQRIRLYEELRQVGLPLGTAMAAMAQLKIATRDLLEAVFHFEPRTHQLLGFGKGIGNVNLPLEDLEQAKGVVADIISTTVHALQDGSKSKAEAHGEILHEVLSKPNIFYYPRENGDVEVRWQLPGGGVDDGGVVLATSLMPEQVRGIIWSKLGVSRRRVLNG